MNLFQSSYNTGVTWQDNQHLSINGTFFFVIEDLKDLFANLPPGQMLLGKFRTMAEAYISLAEQMEIKNIFELGIFRGGSCAFLNALYQPDKLVAIDFSVDRSPELDDYISNNSCEHTLIPYYDLNQGDRDRIVTVLKRDFLDEELDLVVDDASHMLVETTSSFNTLFPRLRAGGLYIIEDWSWAHDPAAFWQKADGMWHDKPALSHLIFEIILSSVSMPDLIETVTVNKYMAVIKKGTRKVDAEFFNISESYLARGREFKPML